MKVVINRCFGGFSLSRQAVRRLAQLHNRPCYFFEDGGRGGKTRWIPLDDDDKAYCAFAFDVPNPQDQPQETLFKQHYIDSRPDNRTDPLLVRVVEELGEAASGDLAQLAIVEIPDRTDWELDDYDGIETIHEKHRSWS